MVMLHERAGGKVFHGALDLPENVSEQLEVLLYAPLFVFALWTVSAIVRRSTREIQRPLVAGVSLLGLAVVLELSGVVTRRLEERGIGHINGARLALEEASELAGWILVATALTAVAVVAVLRTNGGDTDLD